MASRMPCSMPMAISWSRSSTELNQVVVLTCDPVSVSVKRNTIRMEGISVLAAPSGFANPSRTSKDSSGATSRNSQ